MALKRFSLLAALVLLSVGLWAQSFTEREVTISIVGHTAADSMRLAGTLTLPVEVEGQVPAVILITGSGSQNRDEELLGHKPFKVIAEYLSARGYAVLRCDDRGVGGSTGDVAHATTLDFAQDVRHQIRYLQQQELIDADRIFLFGHSEGATVASIVAAGSRGTDLPVAGVAMLGGPGVNFREILLQQNEGLFRLLGTADSLVQRRLACMRDLFAACDTLVLGEGADTVKTINLAFRPIFQRHAAGLTQEQKQQVGLTSVECYGWAVLTATPWMRTILHLNPADYMAQLPCPLLAIGGEKDCQVASGPNLSAIRQVCQAHGVPCTAVELKGINHLGQLCQTGAPNEYQGLGQAPDDQVLLTLLSWLELVRKK